MKKVINSLIMLIISGFMIMGIQVNVVEASINENENLFKKLLETTDDSGLIEYLEENADISSESLETQEFFVRVYETEEENIIDEKVYTEEEYLSEKLQNNGRMVLVPESWIKFKVQASPITSTKSSMLVEYEWLNTPYYQFEDIFTVSSNSTSSLPGANNLVWFSYWPNKSATSVVGTYNNFDNPEKYRFDQINGFSVLHNIRITDRSSSLYKKIEQLPLNQRNNYFYLEAQTTVSKLGYRSKGCPKGTLVFNVDSPTTNGKFCNFLLTYNHREFTVDITPTIGIDQNGVVNISGLTAGLSYSKASTSLKYQWNTTIN